ncbi:hypothetical protein FB446DRAFT_785499 [Lentinula raphanica]|nr:hypothetical protein FB446DRAFT_785499 [Lentinula raphanica]
MSLDSHPSGHLDSPTSQEHVDPGTVNVPGIGSRAFHLCADADDAVSVLGIESRAPHTSGPLEVVGRSLGVLSSGTSSAPDSHRLLRKRTDTDIAGADGSGPLDLHISDPLQPTSAFSTNLLSEAASPDQCKDAREQEGTVIIAHGIASHVPDCSGPLNPSSASIDYPLLQERTSIDIASAHNIETRSTQPADPVLGVPYNQDMKHSKNYDQFLQTTTGKLWKDIDRYLSILHPAFDRFSVKMRIISDSLRAHLSSRRYVYVDNVYNELKDWNSDQYWEDIRDSRNWVDFCSKESGKLLDTAFERMNGQQRSHGLTPMELPNLQRFIDNDILNYHSGQQSMS